MAQKRTPRGSVRHLVGRGCRLKVESYISSQKGGRCCLKWKSIWSSFLPLPVPPGCPCSATQQRQPFFTSMLIPPACLPRLGAASRPHQPQNTVLPKTLIDRTFRRVCCIIWREPSQDRLPFPILWRKSDDRHACRVKSIITSWEPRHSFDPRAEPWLCTAIIVPSHHSVVALSAAHNTAQKSKVKRTQFCFHTHLPVSSGPIQNALISAVAGEGCASQALARGPDYEIRHSAGWRVRRRCINWCWC